MTTPRKRKRETKLKTKTFTGCWTCRSRKVKCDAGRPSCLRCEKSGLRCEGYNVKLYWITNEDTVAPSAIKRQAMTLEGCRTWSFQLDEVDRQIAHVDGQEAFDHVDQYFSTGPFSVFRWETSESHVSTGSPLPVITAERADIDDIDYDYNTTDLDDYLGCDFSEPESQPSPITPASSTWQLQVASPITLGSPLATELHSTIFQDPIIDRLMKNYVLNVANVLPPLPHPESPYASVYVPNALVGAANLVFGVCELGTDLPSSNVAVFYALLATSAFQLRGTDGQSDSGYDLMARSFRAKAFASLQKALEEDPKPNRHHALLKSDTLPASHFETVISAMLAFSSMDIMEGSMSEYWIHLEGVERLARQLRNDGRASPLIDRLITNSSFLSTVANTTSLDLPPVPWSANTSESYDNFEYEYASAQHGLEVTYGITNSLARVMREIVSRSRNISFYVSRGEPLPESLVAACTNLSDALSQWSIDSEPLSRLYSFDSETDSCTAFLLARHHVLAFAHALRVYYHTRILPCNSVDMSYYVNLVAHHLVEIEDIKSQAHYGSNVAATLMWPGFIASCEAKQGPERDVWYQWWTGMLRHRIGNIPQLWTVVQDAWAMRDNEGSTEVPGWIPVLRRSGKRVLAI